MTTSTEASNPSQLAERYFAAVDRMDLAATLACFTPDARFTIATYNTLYQGRDTEIRAMFERLNARYAQVWHGDFDHVVQGPNRIASRFRVENITHAGEKLAKHNCNFFRLRGALFEEAKRRCVGTFWGTPPTHPSSATTSSLV